MKNRLSLTLNLNDRYIYHLQNSLQAVRTKQQLSCTNTEFKMSKRAEMLQFPMYIQEKSIISHKNIGIYSLSKIVTKVVMITLP